MKQSSGRRFRSFLLILVTGLLAGPVLAEGPKPPQGVEVVGRVFVDVDGNGVFSQGDKPLGGVGVTDGMETAETDEKGLYKLQARRDPLLGPRDEPIVTVRFPDGTWPKLHWFVRIDQKKQQEVDFPLEVREVAKPFSFVHATDPHVPWGGAGPMRNFRAHMAARKEAIPFAILTGDLVHVADWKPLAAANRDFLSLVALTRNFPVPLFAVPGNHDLASVGIGRPPVNHPLYGYGLYHKHVGPLRWSFDYGGVHIVGLDCMSRNPKDPNRFGQRQPDHAIKWLEDDLARVKKGTPILLFTHFPFRPLALARICVKYDVTAIYAGHTHSVGQYNLGPLRARLSGSLTRIHHGKETPGYRVITVKGDGVTSRFVEFNPKARGGK